MLSSRRFVRSVAFGCACSLVAACGGGGSSGPGPVPTATPTTTANCQAYDSAARSTTSMKRRSFARVGAPLSDISPNQLYVKYRSTAATSTDTIDRTAGAVHGASLKTTVGLAARAVTLAPGADVNVAAALLRANPDVVSVSPVHLRSIKSAPNDPLFSNYNQWYLFKTDAYPDGWSYSPDGTGVDIAIIDTGADFTNQDLVGKIDYAEQVLNGTVIATNAAAQDYNGHGTNVAGLAAAATNNAYGYAGVGYNAHLQIYNIFPPTTSSSDSQQASTADEAEAIGDAVTHGASIISMSLGGSDLDTGEQEAVENAIAAGVTVVAAGGNEDASSPDYPGAYAGVISVGASSAIDNNTCQYAGITSEGVASYSNSGVTLVAPGGDPASSSDNDYLHWVLGYSTTTTNYAPDACSDTGNVCSTLFAGTSQATPQVSGTVALMMAYHGGAHSLTPAAVLSLLTANTDSIGQPTARQGAGRLDVGKAVAAAHP